MIESTHNGPLKMTGARFNHLLRQIKEGDMSALKPIYDEYYRKMQLTAVCILRDVKDAEDAASQAIMHIIRYAENRERFGVKSAGGFMRATVKNIALDMLKSRSGPPAEDKPYAPDDGEYEEVSRAVLSLPETERDIAVMFYFYGYKTREIAEDMGMPVGTVKWHISEIKRKIYEKIK